MYDDVILSTSIDLDLPPNSDRPVVIYDDILSKKFFELRLVLQKTIKMMMIRIICLCRPPPHLLLGTPTVQN